MRRLILLVVEAAAAGLLVLSGPAQGGNVKWKHLSSVNGAASTFSSDQYGSNRVFEEQASLLVSGPLWKWLGLNVHAQIEQRSDGLNTSRPIWQLYWEDQNNRVTLGQISPQLGGGFVSATAGEGSVRSRARQQAKMRTINRRMVLSFRFLGSG